MTITRCEADGRPLRRRWMPWSIAIACAALIAAPARAQFNSSSTGADGALTFTCPTPQTIEWNPVGLDPQHDNVFEFTTITIGPNCTVKLTAKRLGQAPVVWLATGDVIIDGTVDLAGENGHTGGLGGVRSPAIPGPGGFAGGPGAAFGQTNAGPGYGPGAGGINFSWGAGAGHVNLGQARLGGDEVGAGQKYGSSFLIPLLGGSGGGGSTGGGGGGAGGGAILIASSSLIRVAGAIIANGGTGGFNTGGGGSGGAIRLVSRDVTGDGDLFAVGGNGAGGTNAGSGGRVRIESTTFAFTGRVFADENRAVAVSPSTVIRNQVAVTIPALRVVSVGGVAVPARPSGGFTPADVTVNTAAPVVVQIQGTHIPVGTVVTLEVHHDTFGTSTVPSTPLAGTEALSNATATVTLDSGFSLVTLRADW